MLSKGLIASAEVFESQADKPFYPHYKEFSALFLSKPPAESAALFKKITLPEYKDVPLNIMHQLVNAPSYTEESRVLLEHRLAVHAKLRRFQDKYPSVICSIYETSIQDLETTKRFSELLDVLNNMDAAILHRMNQSGVLVKLAREYGVNGHGINGQRQAFLNRYLSIYNEIDKFELRTQNFSLGNAFSQVSITDQDKSKQFFDFVSVLNLETNQCLEREAVASLYQKFFDPANQISKNVLMSAADVIKQAMALKANKNWNEYFQTVDCANQKKRQMLMQYLEHGFVDLGRAFRNKCFEEYKNLVLKLPKFEISTDMSKDNRAILYQQYKHVVLVTQEMHQISIAPQGARDLPPEAAERKNMSAICRKHTEQITYHRKSYGGFFVKITTNKERDAQARNLFELLDRAKDRNTEHNHIIGIVGTSQDYYNAMLNAIWTSQQEILRSDERAAGSRNKKGYSRLYDISMNLFMSIATDYLNDSDININQKRGLFTLVSAQLTHHIDLLQRRLPEEHTLKNKITTLLARQGAQKWLVGSTELGEIASDLHALDRTTVPKTLHYILDNINCFMTLSAEQSVEGVSHVKFR